MRFPPTRSVVSTVRGLAGAAVLALILGGLAGCGDDGADVRQLEQDCSESTSGSETSGSETAGSDSSSESGSTSGDCSTEGSSPQ